MPRFPKRPHPYPLSPSLLLSLPSLPSRGLLHLLGFLLLMLSGFSVDSSAAFSQEIVLITVFLEEIGRLWARAVGIFEFLVGISSRWLSETYVIEHPVNACAISPLLDHVTVEGLQQGYCVVPRNKRFLVLYAFLKRNLSKKIVVFFSSCNSVKYHSELLRYIHVDFLDIHGKQKQQKRTSRFFEFCKAEKGIYCSTLMLLLVDLIFLLWTGLANMILLMNQRFATEANADASGSTSTEDQASYASASFAASFPNAQPTG
ncbi:hypothetical protein ZIOFF_066133 [Zingiber officinale]|uniref:ATP-dependent RNA helicase n=1 Tax=Zingiber officinale TaxID=94328 RepID=A0A8J5EZ55_ZINOF|nr:hypothetical protein ZIOFF_066133 [Zingiber officinale]